MKRRSLMIGSAVTIGMAAAIRDASADGLIPISIGYDGYSMTTAPMYYASKTGIFKKYGLDEKLIFVSGGSTLSQAGVGGSFDIAQNGYSPAIAATVEGGDLVIVGGISNTLPFQLVVSANINSAADLRGKKLAISKFGSSTDISAGFALKHLGLTRDDVTLLQLGGEGSRTAALMSGQIDGSFEQYPRTAELIAQGFHVLVDLATIDVNYPNTAYVTNRKFVTTQIAVVEKFLMTIIDGVHQYKTNPEQAIAITGEFLNVKDPAIVKQAYDMYNTHVFPNIPWPSEAGITLVLQGLAKKNPKAASFKPEQFVDLTPLNNLQKSGFLAKFQ
ncbi:MAG: hypothetical protein B7Z75_02375 [Acidocella sp. 20-57-95]|nr:MAG: hypothetical protein B7Z75_02375 [Acidocella sp. 20-57-95]HQT63850.1 ABC transporter substrate-binding protein [Acidocella sp.]